MVGLRVFAHLCLIGACGRVAFDGHDGGSTGDGRGSGQPDAPPQVAAPIVVVDNGTLAQCPSLASDGNAIAIAWIDDRAGTNQFDLYLARFDPSGNALGGEIAVTTDHAVGSCPQLFWTGSAYAAVYGVLISGTPQIGASKLDPSGTPLASHALTTCTVGCNFPVATWTGSSLAMVFDDYSDSSHHQLHHLRATLDGATDGDTAVGPVVSSTQLPSVAATTGGDAVVWYDLTANEMHYTYVGSGAPSDSILAVLSPVTYDASANVLTSSAQLVVLDPLEAGHVAVELRDPTTGAALGGAVMLDGFTDPIVAYDGTHVGLVGGAAFQLVAPDGTAIGASLSLPIPTSNTRSAIAAVPGGFGVAWNEQTSSTTFRVRATVVVVP
jgi:hypothetical protein